MPKPSKTITIPQKDQAQQANEKQLMQSKNELCYKHYKNIGVIAERGNEEVFLVKDIALDGEYTIQVTDMVKAMCSQYNINFIEAETPQEKQILENATPCSVVWEDEKKLQKYIVTPLVNIPDQYKIVIN